MLTTSGGAQVSNFLWGSALAINPSDTQSVFAGTESGVFKSTDGGAHWTVARRNNQITALVIAPSNSSIIYAGCDLGDHRDYVLKSVDGGGSWTTIRGELIKDGVSALAIDFLNPNLFYVGTKRGVFKTADGGASWTGDKTRLYGSVVYDIAIDPLKAGAVYAATQAGVFKSLNGGTDWAVWIVRNDFAKNRHLESLFPTDLRSSTLHLTNRMRLTASVR